MLNISKVLAASFLVFVACAQEDAPLSNEEEDIQAIEEMSADRAEAFRRGDAGAIASHFSTDGVLMAPNSPSRIGRQAIEDYYQAIFDEYETDLNSYYEEVNISGDLAFGRGIAEVNLESRSSGERVTATSKYVNILKRESDGSWKTSHDIWNDNE